jgi:hypothetical protein
MERTQVGLTCTKRYSRVSPKRATDFEHIDLKAIGLFREQLEWNGAIKTGVLESLKHSQEQLTCAILHKNTGLSCAYFR